METAGSGNYLSLWEDAVTGPPVAAYPTYTLAEAVGGETTYYISREVKVSESRSAITVEEREAEPGELLRDSSLRYVPDWAENFAYREAKLRAADGNPRVQALERILCKSSILYFVNTYCWCLDPRRGQHPRTPFVTYPFQDDVLTWIVGLVRMGRSGQKEKSREMGASWMAVAAGVWLCLFYEMREALYMSMREEDVDDRTMDSLFGKIRYMLKNLPDWMRGGWTEGSANDNSMKLFFPESGSAIKGILSRGTAGRSGRATVCFNDEFAFVEDSTAVLAAMSELANAKIYISTANGMGNEFYRMASDPATNKKTLHWAMHPLKNTESQRLKRNEPDMTEEIWASEQEIAYEVSTVGRVFPEFLSFPSDDLPWVHIQDGPFVQYDPAYDTYTSSDLGISDPCSTLFMQLKPAPPELSAYGEYCRVFFDEHEARNMTAFDLRYLINSKGYRYREHVIDMRTGAARDSSGRTWRKNLADSDYTEKPTNSKFFNRVIVPGPPIIAKGKISYVRPTLETMRIQLNTPGAIVVSKQGCPNFIRSVQNWSFPIDRETRKPKTDADPNHDQWSHSCKAALYLIDWLDGKEGKRTGDKIFEYPATRLHAR